MTQNMEGIGGNLRVLSRSSSSSSNVVTPSSSSSIPLSPSSIPYTSVSASLNFPPPPSHTLSPSPSYLPSGPPLPLSLLNSSVSARAVPANNPIHPGAKITILTSSASSLPSSVSSSTLSSIPSNIPSNATYSTPSGQGHSVAAVGESPSLSSPGDGVVVVGAIGRTEEDVSQLLNRLLDAQVFGCRGKVYQENSVPLENFEGADGFEEAGKQMGNLSDFVEQPRILNNGGDRSHIEEHLAGKRGNEEEGKLSSVYAVDEITKFQSQDPVLPSKGNLQKQTVEKKDSRQLDLDSKPFCSNKSLKSSKRLHWMRNHLTYHYDEEKGVVYVQFAWGLLPTQLLNENISIEGLPSLMEQCDGNSLRGLLYMFSVCHVILLIQEGARVDTHLLRTFRILQNAKHLFAPFVKTQVLPGLHLSPAIGRGSSVRPLPRSTGHSPGRSGASGRSASTIALMSGSAPSLFPGQCTPVLLFVFLEDFTDASVSSLHTNPHIDDNTDSPGGSVSQQGASISQAVGPVLTSRPTLQIKGSNPVVMLARSNKSEGGLRKKLHSSLEAQVRFLIKKCKILAGSGDAGSGIGSGMGPRGPGNSAGSVLGTLGGSALFVLDTMRVVCLVDRGPNLIGDSLEATMGIMNDMLRGKEVGDDALIELKGNAGEDIQAVRDFIWRQAETLRGRGGVLTNSTGGSMGVGMVAAAAAAAAASAAAGSFGGSSGALKPLGNPPELPNISNWLSACQVLVEVLACGESQSTADMNKVLSIRVAQTSRNSRKGSSELPNVSIQGKDVLGATLGSLECGMGLDMTFSAGWCKRMLPSALAVYTKGLPLCYPTSVHRSHLEKALHTFQAMVRGPAVVLYTNKLKEECEALWKSGRQLCDAVSLTHKPCIYKVHDVPSVGTTLSNTTKSNMDRETNLPETSVDIPLKLHSSGFVFLHACACGRSRRLRDDPFDFDSANVTFFQFPNCDDLLPSMKIPPCEGNKPLGGSAWSLVRLGGANYYQHSTGLLQSGFCLNQKFLSAWNISYMAGGPRDVTKNYTTHVAQPDPPEPLPKASPPLVGTMTFLDALGQGKANARTESEPHACVHGKPNPVETKKPNERKQSSVKGYNLGEGMLFSNVVARNGYDGDVAFPPLQQRQIHQPGPISVKNVRQAGRKEKKDGTQLGQAEPHITGKFEPLAAAAESSVQNGEHLPMPAEDIVRTVLPSTVSRVAPFTDSSGKPQGVGIDGMEHATVYLGFEHECPRGHRFLLSYEQMKTLGLTASQSGYSLSAVLHKSTNCSASAKVSKHNHKFLQSTGYDVTSSKFFVPGQESGLKPDVENLASNLKVHDDMHCKVLDGGSGEGYTLLNTDLPVYLTCPYCSKTSDHNKRKGVAYAGNISQLQRIFLVTPPLPLLLAACPVVKFDKSCIPEVAQQRGNCSNEFSLGSSVVLPPESFVILRLPFVYYMELNDGSRYPLKSNVHQPESTAWLIKGSTFQIISKDGGATDV